MQRNYQGLMKFPIKDAVVIEAMGEGKAEQLEK